MNARLTMGAYVAEEKGEDVEYSYIQDDTKGERVGNYYFASFYDIVPTAKPEA